MLRKWYLYSSDCPGNDVRRAPGKGWRADAAVLAYTVNECDSAEG